MLIGIRDWYLPGAQTPNRSGKGKLSGSVPVSMGTVRCHKCRNRGLCLVTMESRDEAVFFPGQDLDRQGTRFGGDLVLSAH